MEASSLDLRIGRAFYGTFSRFSAVQERAEKPLLEGLDAIILSGTGSGKTVAVMAPLVQRHLATPLEDAQGAIIYVIPTKALGNDVVRRIELPLETLGLSVGLRHGDAPRSGQAHLKNVVVITPESLDVLISSGADLLKGTRALVIDEAHLLYNTQRGLQLASLIRRLETRGESSIQVVALSATIASPEYLWRFFRPQIAEDKLRIIEGAAGRPIQAVARVEQAKGDLAALIEKVGQQEHFKALIFVSSRREADRLAAEMQRESSFEDSVFIHHSSIASEQREQTEQEFSARARAICVATSTLELGIDIGDIDLVVLYGFVGGWESFLQRIGRGSRRESHAKVLCIAPYGAQYKWLIVLAFLGMLRVARSGGGSSVEPMELHGAVAQQMLSMLRENKGSYTRLAEIAEVFAPWSHLARSTIDAIADSLIEKGGCVRHVFQNRIGAGEHLHELERWRLLWGNFPKRSRDIPLIASEKEIGKISASNLPRLSPGQRIRFAGRVWTITSTQADRINVTAAQDRSNTIELTYFGTGFGVDPSALETARQMLIDNDWTLDELAEKGAKSLEEKWRGLNQLLAYTKLPFARKIGEYCYFTFAGRLVNDVICRWEGLDKYRVDDLCIWSPRSIDFRRIPETPQLLEKHAEESLAKAGELTIFQSMLPDSLLRKDVVEPWRRTPYYAQALRRLASAEPKEIENSRLHALLA